MAPLPTEGEDVVELLASWAARPHNTARSILVTIFGDSVLPIRNDIWLSQLFRLTEIFGFSTRLVRTSMFRLTAEGWFTSERSGRQSIYTLTPFAIEESNRAASRIYRAEPADWSGPWSVVVLDAAVITDDDRRRLTQHLRWRGFMQIGNGVFGSPETSTREANKLCKSLGLGSVPVGSLEFSNLAAAVGDGYLIGDLDIAAQSEVLREFIDVYGPLTAGELSCTPIEAFGLRTALVHDLRRIRLHGPDLPGHLFPFDWLGERATAIAAALYATTSRRACSALSEILDRPYPAKLPGRFETH